VPLGPAGAARAFEMYQIAIEAFTETDARGKHAAPCQPRRSTSQQDSVGIRQFMITIVSRPNGGCGS
jgi:hypothetical protein